MHAVVIIAPDEMRFIDDELHLAFKVRQVLDVPSAVVGDRIAEALRQATFQN